MRCITFDTNIAGRPRTSQYWKFNYNSMVKFQGKMLGANGTGLFNLTGDYDVGDSTVPIDAWIKTGMTDLGIQANKRLRHIYLGVETFKDLEIELYADNKLVKTVVARARKRGQQRIRVTVGRYKGVYWSFKIKNKLGAWFAIDIIQVNPGATLPYGNI